MEIVKNPHSLTEKRKEYREKELSGIAIIKLNYSYESPLQYIKRREREREKERERDTETVKTESYMCDNRA